MSSFALIQVRGERHFAEALTAHSRSLIASFCTGLRAIDRQTKAIPQGTITQICVNKEAAVRNPSRQSHPICNEEQGSYKRKQNICRSEDICRSEAEAAVAVPAKGRILAGNSAVLFSILAQTTGSGHFCALVDASDCFDPASAEAAGMDLSRVLWVRCGGKPPLKPLEQAFKAADILVQNGGFGLIAVDLSNIEERQIRKVPLTTWFRFARVVDKKPIALVFLTPYRVAQSCVGLTLEMTSSIPRWSPAGHIGAQPGMSLVEMELEIEIAEKRLRKPVQSARPKFAAVPVWA